MRGRTAIVACGRTLAGFVLVSMTGCIASNVVAVADRTVVNDVDELQWRPVTSTDVPGLFESVEIRGKAAGSLRKVYYLFEENGHYAASALVAGDDGMKFQVVDGSWQLTAEGLVLDDSAATPVEIADDHMRLRSESGVVVLRRSVVR
jgi:hypothetical protein